MLVLSFLLTSISLLTFWLVLPLLFPPIAFVLAALCWRRKTARPWACLALMLYAALTLTLQLTLLSIGYQA